MCRAIESGIRNETSASADPSSHIASAVSEGDSACETGPYRGFNSQHHYRCRFEMRSMCSVPKVRQRSRSPSVADRGLESQTVADPSEVSYARACQCACEDQGPTGHSRDRSGSNEQIMSAKAVIGADDPRQGSIRRSEYTGQVAGPQHSITRQERAADCPQAVDQSNRQAQTRVAGPIIA
uniref:Uncharacterized protein n=1 Tax=Knipowitschia caucasica TaxID=637954 RepID=A0AAV2KWG2_KNICA